MDLNDTPEQAAFRKRVQAWIAENRDASPPLVAGLHVPDPTPYREWQRLLCDGGLVGVTWPEEYGGAGLGPAEQMIANGELAAAGCAMIVDHIAIGELGPTIIAYGTEEQRERYLAPMLRAEEGWCQLFSEPGAGSDLAGITTRATLEDGRWRINGQKVWTTMAQFADFGILLARTNPDVQKHRGLTMFIVPMDAPGVTVRPLRLISGAAMFNEVFFDDVELEADAAVGEVDDGWSVSVTTLMFERMALLAVLDSLPVTPDQIIAPLLGNPALDQSHVRLQIATVAADWFGLQYSAYRALSALQHGAIPGAEAGLGKIGVIEAGRLACDLIAEVLGPDALEGQWGEYATEMPGMRSAGGTEEILRNTVGERILGLPPEPRFDKDKPFSELARSGRTNSNGASPVGAQGVTA